MILAISRFKVRNGLEGQVQAAFLARPHLVDGVAGFLGMETYTETGDPALFYLVTRWTDVASYQGWHNSAAHHRSHNGIPRGLKLDASFTRVALLDRLAYHDRPEPMEALIMDAAPVFARYLADSSACHYLTADLDDGLDSGILALEQIREGVPIFRGFHDAALRRYPAAASKLIVYEALKQVLNALVTDLLSEVRRRVVAIGATTLDEIRQAPERLAALSEKMEAERAAAKRFLYANLYNSAGMEEAHRHAETVVEGLFGALIGDPGLLPEDHRMQIPAEGLARTAADYIAGMTDSYVEEVWGRCGGM